MGNTFKITSSLDIQICEKTDWDECLFVFLKLWFVEKSFIWMDVCKCILVLLVFYHELLIWVFSMRLTITFCIHAYSKKVMNCFENIETRKWKLVYIYIYIHIIMKQYTAAAAAVAAAAVCCSMFLYICIHMYINIYMLYNW